MYLADARSGLNNFKGKKVAPGLLLGSEKGFCESETPETPGPPEASMDRRRTGPCSGTRNDRRRHLDWALWLGASGEAPRISLKAEDLRNIAPHAARPRLSPSSAVVRPGHFVLQAHVTSWGQESCRKPQNPKTSISNADIPTPRVSAWCLEQGPDRPRSYRKSLRPPKHAESHTLRSH